jgi:hypothetical protein
MPYPDGRIKQPSFKPGHQARAERSRRWPFFLAGILLMLVILACGGSADGVALNIC